MRGLPHLVVVVLAVLVFAPAAHAFTVTPSAAAAPTPLAAKRDAAAARARYARNDRARVARAEVDRFLPLYRRDAQPRRHRLARRVPLLRARRPHRRRLRPDLRQRGARARAELGAPRVPARRGDAGRPGRRGGRALPAPAAQAGEEAQAQEAQE